MDNRERVRQRESEREERQKSDDKEGMVRMSSCANISISLNTMMSVGEIVAFQQQEKALGG